MSITTGSTDECWTTSPCNWHYGAAVAIGLVQRIRRFRATIASIAIGDYATTNFATSVVPLIPVYPDSAAGLDKLMKGMLELEKHGDTNALAPYLQSLVLPNPDAWFKSIFGDTVGAQLALSYEPTAKGLPQAMAATLKKLRQDGFAGHFEVVDFNEALRRTFVHASK